MNLRSTIVRYKLHHLLIWCIVALVWYYLRFQDYSTSEKAIKVTIIKTVDLAIMIYLANYVLIPFLLYKKRYVTFVFCFIAMILVSSGYKMYLIGKITNNPALLNWTGNLKGRIYDNVIPHFFLVIAGVACKLLLDYTRVQKRLAEVAREKAEAELNFLKSQINPHFLFNSLNAVYFLIDKNNTEARQALHKFSDMLRYQLYEVRDEKIPIEKELGYLQDYIALQQLRSDNCSVHIDVDENMKSFSIEPLLLIPFVENSFKHLSHFSGKKNEINIGLSRKNGEMNFMVRNTTEGRHRTPSTEGGIGLNNVKRRLELLYPMKHQLRISEEGGWFDIDLTIKIDH
ncbi:MAG TPA: histidine kinase [Flavisolibacter sp.]|nr:histidine kinase [Flavisolibacter sp.]